MHLKAQQKKLCCKNTLMLLKSDKSVSFALTIKKRIKPSLNVPGPIMMHLRMFYEKSDCL